MIKWTEETLKSAGYEIKNAKITSVDLDMRDHCVLTLLICLDGSDWGCIYGGYALGHGYLGADDDFFDGSPKGIESIERIMDVVGVETFNKMKDQIVRVATKGYSPIKIIGNVMEDRWFDIDSFFKEST